MKTFLFRTGSSVVLLTLFFCSILLKGPLGFAIFSTIAVFCSFFAAVELCSILASAGRKSYPFLVSTTISLLVASVLLLRSPLGGGPLLIVGTLICLQAWLIILFAKGRQEVVERALCSLGVVLMLGLPLSLLTFFYVGMGPLALLFLILVTKAGDIGAYLVGTVTNKLMKGGNHKMIPSISPGKSWEGAIGGALLSIGVSMALGNFFVNSMKYAPHPLVPINEFLFFSSILNPHPLTLAAVLGFVLFLSGFIGDLSESSLKRVCGVKDSGRVLPGIGGLMDLLDSLLFSGPVFLLYIIFLNFAQIRR